MTRKQKGKRITELIDKYRPALFLGEWKFDHTFVDGEHAVSDPISGWHVQAEIKVNYTYKKAMITTYKSFWESTQDEQEETICHEMSHCHTQQLWDFCTDFANGKHHTPDEVCAAVETLTQRISIIAKYGGV